MMTTDPDERNPTSMRAQDVDAAAPKNGQRISSLVALLVIIQPRRPRAAAPRMTTMLHAGEHHPPVLVASSSQGGSSTAGVSGFKTPAFCPRCCSR